MLKRKLMNGLSGNDRLGVKRGSSNKPNHSKFLKANQAFLPYRDPSPLGDPFFNGQQFN